MGKYDSPEMRHAIKRLEAYGKLDEPLHLLLDCLLAESINMLSEVVDVRTEMIAMRASIDRLSERVLKSEPLHNR